jgi:phage terminase small subunit
VISKKHLKFIDEYFIDLNASAAAIRTGYAEASARQTAYKILQHEGVKAEVAKRMKDSRMSADEVIKRLEAMAQGDVPTKTVKYDGEIREEYDVISATDKMGKIYALFVDKQIVENIGLEIIDDDE